MKKLLSTILAASFILFPWGGVFAANTYSLDLELDSSQYAKISDASQTGLDPAEDITIEAWVKQESNPAGGKTIAGKWGAGQREYYLHITTSGKLEFAASDDGTANAGHFVAYDTDAAAVSVGVWAHVAVTYDISVETPVFYVNGSSVAFTQTAGTTIGPAILNGTGDFSIGDLNVGDYFDGLIDEVRIWSDVRTASEIANNYQIELVGNEANLVGYWKLNNDYLDETANNNDLTAVNSPVFSTDVPFVGATPTPEPNYNIIIFE